MAKMGKPCDCSECVNKGACPHCDGNAPKSKCICGQTNKASKPDYIDIDGDGNKTESMKEAAKDAKVKKTEYGQRLKKPMKQLCDKCGADVIVPKGAIRGSDNSRYCKRCNPQSKNPFTRKD